jgi:hypothetical protein
MIANQSELEGFHPEFSDLDALVRGENCGRLIRDCNTGTSGKYGKNLKRLILNLACLSLAKHK